MRYPLLFALCLICLGIGSSLQAQGPRRMVNEPIDDAKGSVAELRPSVWLTQLGPKYIDMAFRLAHRVDPSAVLVLNEYDIECVGEAFTARREALHARDRLQQGCEEDQVEDRLENPDDDPRGVAQEDDLDAAPGEFLEDQHLIGILA